MKRKATLEQLEENKEFDILIIGGGITGAGIARRAALYGLKTLLIEKRDFSWGTSSRSGKLVHGGLRYIKQGQLKITYHSVKEREKLLKFYKKIIHPLDFILPLESKNFAKKLMYEAGLTLYDAFALKRNHKFTSFKEIKRKASYIRSLHGGYIFRDAKTDDSTLTLQILKEAESLGALVINYLEAIKIEKIKSYKTVIMKDKENGKIHEATSKVVILATSAWSDKFDNSIKLRKLKGSHIILPKEKLPIKVAVAIFHPIDKRPLYILPWRNTILFGTTDIDFKGNINTEIKISSWEIDYLLDALKYWFPSTDIEEKDILSVFSGVRSVIDTGKKDPSKEKRDYILNNNDGIITVTGGKLTTFDYIAKNVLKETYKFLNKPLKVFSVNLVLPNDFSENIENLLLKYELLEKGTLNSKDLAHLIHTGHILHLEDLLLRRSRIGLLHKDGGISKIKSIKPTLQRLLNWDNSKWNQELKLYISLIKNYYRI